jgi:rSAM/selenodomain-associated transferase 2
MISVIIPTLNEAENLRRLLDSLLAEPGTLEVIVVDGGSTDGTPQVALSNGIDLVPSPPGRGRQLHAGAEAANGDILLFLHADCRFPQCGLQRIETVLAKDPRIVGGNHRLIFDGADRFSRWLDGFYAWIRSHGVYYGDSGIFVRRAVFDEIGGIRPIALMEDFDFVRRMERFGGTVCIAEPPLVTSSRRFEGRHPVAIVWGWLKIHALYYLGVSPARLARLYDSERRKGSPRTD